MDFKDMRAYLIFILFLITFSGCEDPLSEKGLMRRLEGRWDMSTPASRISKKLNISGNNYVSTYKYATAEPDASVSTTITYCFIEAISKNEIRLSNCETDSGRKIGDTEYTIEFSGKDNFMMGSYGFSRY